MADGVDDLSLCPDSEAYYPEAINSDPMLGFFSEPINIYFLKWSYWAHAWACQASAQGKVSEVNNDIT